MKKYPPHPFVLDTEFERTRDAGKHARCARCGKSGTAKAHHTPRSPSKEASTIRLPEGSVAVPCPTCKGKGHVGVSAEALLGLIFRTPTP